MADDTNTPTPPKPRGFALLSRERRQEIARKGAAVAKARGTAHRFTSEEAREAGKKGGRSISQNRQYMSELGRRGGHTNARWGKRLDPLVLPSD